MKGQTSERERERELGRNGPRKSCVFSYHQGWREQETETSQLLDLVI